MTYTQATRKASEKWKQKNYKNICFAIPISLYNEIKAAADTAGESVNGYIRKACQLRMNGGQEQDSTANVSPDRVSINMMRESPTKRR